MIFVCDCIPLEQISASVKDKNIAVKKVECGIIKECSNQPERSKREDFCNGMDDMYNLAQEISTLGKDFKMQHSSQSECKRCGTLNSRGNLER